MAVGWGWSGFWVRGSVEAWFESMDGSLCSNMNRAGGGFGKKLKMK